MPPHQCRVQEVSQTRFQVLPVLLSSLDLEFWQSFATRISDRPMSGTRWRSSLVVVKAGQRGKM